MNKYFFIAILLLVTSCAVQHTKITEDYLYHASLDEGVLLLSITEAEYEHSWERRWFPHISYSRKGFDDYEVLSSFVYGSLGSNNALGRDKYKNSTDYPNKKGSLIAVVLPSGEYSITGVGVFVNGLEIWETRKNDWQAFDFSVSPGEITYLGDFEFYIGKYKNNFGFDVKKPEGLNIKSSKEDDLMLFYLKYPQLRGLPVKEDIDFLKLAFENDTSIWELLFGNRSSLKAKEE